MANGVAAVSLGTFDTHAFIKRLIAAGLPEASAETFADEQVRLIEKMSEKVASKEELRAHVSTNKADFKRAEARVDSKFDLLRKDNEMLRKDMLHEISELRKDMVAMETRSDAKFDVLRAEMSSMKWVLGILAAGSIGAFIKSFF